MSIKNVIICGLGALGSTYAYKLNKVCNLKILADEKRVEKYRKNGIWFNGEKFSLDFILPNDSFNADLIIISTKSNGLEDAVKYIKNFVGDNTIIISLINGISSEDVIASVFGNERVIRSYFIGHSAMRKDNNIVQDGIGKLVIEPCERLEIFLRKNNIDHEVCENIIYSQWVKLGVNIILNEQSAIYNLSVGELKSRKDFSEIAKKLIKEIKSIAIAENILNIDNYESDVINSVKLIAGDGKTSMLQDVLAKRKTEVDIFSGEIIRLAKKHNILTPENIRLYNKIKDMEKDYQ